MQGLDSPHWHIDHSLLNYRVPTWMNWQYNITGLLYWTTITSVESPWTNPVFRSNDNGGGYLLYPGTPCGIEGPVPCIRLKNLRDSMEDYEYFAILQERGGKEAVDAFVDQIAPNWWNYSKNPARYTAVRTQIAEAIVGAVR